MINFGHLQLSIFFGLLFIYLMDKERKRKRKEKEFKRVNENIARLDGGCSKYQIKSRFYPNNGRPVRYSSLLRNKSQYC